MSRASGWIAVAVLMTLFLAVLAMPARADCGGVSGGKMGQTAPYDPAVLVKTYDCLLAVKSPGGMLTYPANRIETLEGAGVKNLLSGPGGLPLAERVAILNDYGQWQNAVGRYDEAQATLRLAVQLAPDDAAGWLGLGDSYATAISDQGRWTDELTLTKKALNAYERYVALTPAPAPRITNFLKLNLTSAATNNVCEFVADLSSEGRLDEILTSLGGAGFDAEHPSIPVDLFGNGSKYYVYIEQPESGGGPWLPDEMIGIYKAPVDTEVVSQDEFFPADKPSDVDLSPLMTGRADEMAGQLAVFRIKTLYYILVSKPSDANDAIQGQGALDVRQDPRNEIDIVQPNHGVICHILPNITANLALGQGNPLCEQFLAGAKFPQPTQDLAPANDIITVNPGDQTGRLLATSKVDLENNGQIQTLAFYDDGWSTWVTPYDPDKRAAIESRLSTAITYLKPNILSEEYFILYAGRTYIEIDHDRDDTLPGEAVGEGIYEVRSEKVFPVCLIRNDFTYGTVK